MAQSWADLANHVERGGTATWKVSIARGVNATSGKTSPCVLRTTRKIAPPPMKPTPVKMPSGNRIRSFMIKESLTRPDKVSR